MARIARVIAPGYPHHITSEETADRNFFPAKRIISFIKSSWLSGADDMVSPDSSDSKDSIDEP